MKNIKEIVNLLRETSSSNEKIMILRINEDNELLKKVLEYTYNPYKKYGVSEKILNTISSNKTSSKNIFDLLDILSSNNINDSLRNEIGAFKNSCDDWELCRCMILKDLRCNISAKTINKVWPGLIPEFDVMRADNYHKNKNMIKGNVIASSKIDGFKCIAIKLGEDVKLLSRTGKEYDGVVDVENIIKKINKHSIVIDGELYAIGEFENNEDGYKATSKIMRTKGIKHGVKLVSYDCLEIEEFSSGKSKLDTLSRKNKLKKILSNINPEYIEYLEPLYIGDDLTEVERIGDEEIKKGEEGIIVSVADAMWEAKKSKGCLKLKISISGDVLVKSIYEGTGKYKSMMGGVTCEFIYDGKICSVDVGSGWKDKDREYLFKNQNKIVGKVITIECRGITEDKDGNKSLRHPSIGEFPHCVRIDKNCLEDTSID